MIVGVGTDLLEIARIMSILEQGTGRRFLERVLTPAERCLADRRQKRLAEFVAGRFAAKEAVVKALGCGLGKLVSLQDIEVLPDSLGKPVCRISEAAWQRLGMRPAELGKGQGGIILHLSISHSETMAMAYAVAEQVDSPPGARGRSGP
ncbi:holo-[acyl-carrier protein] synthase [Paenibacillus sp. UNCCL117]|uniref:holo-ACP synthase n=1 Tax=unclassified Paenibacillus TaxID=185978 RepID=UPI000887BA4C|nr:MULTISPECIES: holo-ACP synthase [unclassified Paenibacillus]SDE63081.1 holo-[acyl-carrier-protein] synthase [Paenibacillus sp. cl123]SFW70203.1 holo-[acyl-carrier protein] synthase [Paenibacillus sp. UNCCL117]